MRILVQRVKEASVEVNHEVVGEIQQGLLLLIGIEEADTDEDMAWLAKKIVNLRIFDDEAGMMNRSLLEVQGAVLAVSQFTLHAAIKKGNRPSYVKAASPRVAEPIYEQFCDFLGSLLQGPVAKGVFGAHMDVLLVNDGPVTIWMDSKDRV